MTLRQLLLLVGAHTQVMAVVLGAPPLAAVVSGLLHKRGAGNDAPWKYVYSAIVYATCLPGLLATVLTSYDLVFRRANLLDMNLVYTLPIVSMIGTLVIIGRKVDFEPLPGFGRLSGLMAILGLTFIAIIVIMKTHIFLFFGGSIWTLLALGASLIAAMNWAIGRMDGKKLPDAASPVNQCGSGEAPTTGGRVRESPGSASLE
jgi:hypothetical protein